MSEIVFKDRLGRLMVIRGVRDSGDEKCLCGDAAAKCDALGCGCVYYRTSEPDDVA